MSGDGDSLPVSAMPAGGTFPVGTSKYEKRFIAAEIPVWDENTQGVDALGPLGEVGRGRGLELELHGAGLDLGGVEDVGDELAHALGRLPHVAEIGVYLLRGELAAPRLHDGGEAVDAGQGAAQVVDDAVVELLAQLHEVALGGHVAQGHHDADLPLVVHDRDQAAEEDAQPLAVLAAQLHLARLARLLPIEDAQHGLAQDGLAEDVVDRAGRAGQGDLAGVACQDRAGGEVHVGDVAVEAGQDDAVGDGVDEGLDLGFFLQKAVHLHLLVAAQGPHHRVEALGQGVELPHPLSGTGSRELAVGRALGSLDEAAQGLGQARAHPGRAQDDQDRQRQDEAGGLRAEVGAGGQGLGTGLQADDPPAERRA